MGCTALLRLVHDVRLPLLAAALAVTACNMLCGTRTAELLSEQARSQCIPSQPQMPSPHHKYYRHVQLIGKTLGGTCTSQFTQLLCDVTAGTTALGTAAAGKGARYINVAAAFEGPLAAGQCGAPHAVCTSNLIADCRQHKVCMLRKAQDERVFWAQDPVHSKLVTCVATPVDAVDLCQHNGCPQRYRVEEHQCYDAPNPAKPG